MRPAGAHELAVSFVRPAFPFSRAIPIVTSGRSSRVVLDTNIWLDWLVFEDSGVVPIKAAVDCGEVEIAIDARCEQELARVLAYPLRKTTLPEIAQRACLAKCRNLASMGLGNGTTELPSGKTACAGPLPVCRDHDDQKFLELARDSGADFLITKDKALLVLNRRRLRTTPFRIVTPSQFGIDLESRR